MIIFFTFADRHGSWSSSSSPVSLSSSCWASSITRTDLTLKWTSPVLKGFVLVTKPKPRMIISGPFGSDSGQSGGRSDQQRVLQEDSLGEDFGQADQKRYIKEIETYLKL